jgi:hypothetical protein
MSAKNAPGPLRVAAEPHNGTSGALAGNHAIPTFHSERPESPQNSLCELDCVWTLLGIAHTANVDSYGDW